MDAHKGVGVRTWELLCRASTHHSLPEVSHVRHYASCSQSPSKRLICFRPRPPSCRSSGSHQAGAGAPPEGEESSEVEHAVDQSGASPRPVRRPLNRRSFCGPQDEETPSPSVAGVCTALTTSPHQRAPVPGRPLMPSPLPLPRTSALAALLLLCGAAGCDGLHHTAPHAAPAAPW